MLSSTNEQNYIETRGEARRRKHREREAARRAEHSSGSKFKQGDRERQAKRSADGETSEAGNAKRRRLNALRQNEDYVRTQNETSNNRQKIRRTACKIARVARRIARDREADEIATPLRVMEMNDAFQKEVMEYAAWPQPVTAEVSKHALADFRDKIKLDNLRELPCAVCSRLFNKNYWRRISVESINLSLLKAPVQLTAPSFEIDFRYEHPLIDGSGLQILLDKAGFIYPQGTDSFNPSNPFDLRVCNICYKHLQEGKTPSLSLANNMWIGPTPPCLQGLTIPEQLLISPGYLCLNLIQLTGKKHTHHKLKGHIVTLPQNPTSLTKVLPLPMYQLCENLKVVFVGPGTPTERQLKKILQVRKSRVSAALQWLFEHNILFKDNLELDEIALGDLPEGEIPIALMATTTIVDIDSRRVEHYTGYTQDSSQMNDDDDGSEDGDKTDDEEDVITPLATQVNLDLLVSCTLTV